VPLSPTATRELLTRLGRQPVHRLGQNFLVDGNIVRKSLALAGVAAGDTVVEVGPGLGTLTSALLEAGATVWAVDVNERALELCARNAATAGLANVRCVTPEDRSLPPRFTRVWSNPPIRIGKDALHSLLSSWLGRLAPGGQAHLVVGRNLGADSLHQWLAGQGWLVTRLSARSGYRLLQVDFYGRTGRVKAP